MMKSVVMCGIVLAAASAALCAQGPKNISENLDGYAEVPFALSTSGQGRFHARISNDGTRIAYELSYAATETLSLRLTSTSVPLRRRAASASSSAPTWLTVRPARNCARPPPRRSRV